MASSLNCLVCCFLGIMSTSSWYYIIFSGEYLILFCTIYMLALHRDEKKLVIEADIETAIIYAAVLYKKAYDPMDESKRKYICNYAEKNKFDEVICSIRLWFSDDIYSIGIEDIKKISILNNNENIDVKFGGKYIVKNVSKISGYIVFYNYCEQLRNIKLFYEKIKANFKNDIEFHEIAKVYIL